MRKDRRGYEERKDTETEETNLEERGEGVGGLGCVGSHCGHTRGDLKIKMRRKTRRKQSRMRRKRNRRRRRKRRSRRRGGEKKAEDGQEDMMRGL